MEIIELALEDRETRTTARFGGLKMAQYAIAFDLDTASMTNDGFTKAQIVAVYQTEIPKALALSGFTAHPQGSLYHTESDQDPITAVMTLLSSIHNNASNFCHYVRRAHVFRMEEWSDVTALITNTLATSAPPPTAEEEVEVQTFGVLFDGEPSI